MNEEKMEYPPMPNCDKLGEVREYRDKIIEFFDWLAARNGVPRGVTDTQLERAILEFFEIDPDELERERMRVFDTFTHNAMVSIDENNV